FIEETETNPRCPECGKSTDWGMTLRRQATKSVSQHDERRNQRHCAPKGFPHISRIEWGGLTLDDVHVVNYSAAGIAVEVSEPAIFFGSAELTLENGNIIPGVIRYCQPY